MLLWEHVGEIFSNPYITCDQEWSSKHVSLKKFCRADERKNLLFHYCFFNFFSTYKSNKDFDFVGYQNSLSILFSQCKVSLCERNTHDVSSLLALLKIGSISTALSCLGENYCSTNHCKDLLTIENIDSNLKVHALYYANELLVLAVQKLLQTRRTSRNNKKLSKTGFGYG